MDASTVGRNHAGIEPREGGRGVVALIDEVEQKRAHAATSVNSLGDDGCIIRKNRSHRVQFRDHDQLREALTAGGLALSVDADHSNPLNVQVGIQITDTLKTLTVSGDPIGVSRGHVEVSYDDGAFLGVLFQKAGRTVRSSLQGQTIINPGDLVIWHGRHSLRFDMPEYFQKVCLLAPIETFERVLPDAESYAGLHLQEHLNVSRLLGACFSTLANRVLTNDTEPPNTALEVALDLLGAALTRHRESNDIGPRTNLFQRVTTFIEKRLGDSQLSPTMLAAIHHISTRYLHLVFSERGTTVGTWIRSRRLARCREELAKPRSDRTITEISMGWGFNDVAHFSRSFKSAYGVSPLTFRLARRRLHR